MKPAAKLRDDETRAAEQELVPPLFASLFADTASAGVDGRAVDRAITEAMSCLEDDCYVGALGKFREAWTLSSSHQNLREKVQQATLRAAESLVQQNWRVAQALLLETASTANELWAEIAGRKRTDAIQLALDDAARVDRNEYLPHVRQRLSEMVKAYPSEPALEARLCALDELIAQRAADDREKNLRRLYLFSDRLDYTDNAATWRRFPELVAPFSDPYPADPAFAAVFTEVHGLQSAFENAEALLAESRTRDCLKICNGVLERRPGNLLFRRLEEKAKGREWVSLLAESAAQRARAFEAHAQYVEALEEWESLRGIDPHYPGLDSEILNCAALRERSGNACPAERQLFEEVPAEEIPLVAETREEWTEIEPPAFAHRNRPNLSPLGIRISMTEEAWNHFKTGLAATAALLLVVLVLASHARP